MPSSLSRLKRSALLVVALVTNPVHVKLQSQARDTASVHSALRGAINEFNDKFRGKWQSAELKRHRPMDMRSIRGVNGDRDRNNLTTELRRYYELLCFIGNPSEDEFDNPMKYRFGSTSKAAAKRKEEYAKPKPTKSTAGPDPRSDPLNMPPPTFMASGVNWAMPRQITPRPNSGAVCPSWLPPDDDVPLDEGEAIDLALPIKERPLIRAERDKLLAILDAAQKSNPDDNWITGQRVRFAYDQRDATRTTAAANDCRGDAAWCLSLKGFAQQQAEQFADAEKTFRQAEAAAPAGALTDSLCGNGETLLLLNHDDRDVITARPCNEQRTLIDRVWWLGDPLWSVPGNERYIAHNVRKLHATLRAVTDRDERYVWQQKSGGDAMRELIIRYGWPSYTYWGGREVDARWSAYREVTPNKNWMMAPPYTAKEYSSDRTALLPSGKALTDPFGLDDDAWQLYSPDKDVDNWWPQEHFFYPTHIGTLKRGQDVMWRRDTSIAYQLAVDDPLQKLDPSSTSLSKAVLFGGDGPTTTRQLAQSAIGAGGTLRLSTNIPSAPLFMSAEILPRALIEQAMRRRYAVRPPSTLRGMKNGEVALSEPVLMRLPNRTMPVPVDQASVIRYMAGDLAFINDEPLALYWESYGFAPGDTVNVELKFRRDDDLNIGQRLLGAVGIGGARDSVSIRWTEPDPRHAATIVSGTKPVIGRSVAVDLMALQDGAYVLSMEMRKGQALAARSERRITVKKRTQ